MFCSRITPEIAAEVDQGLLAGADMLAIDHPFFGMRRGQGEPGLGECLEHPGPEDLGQGLVAEQIGGVARAGLGAPESCSGIDRRRRHDQVDMGMVVEAAGMGMQHGDGAGRAPDLAVIAAEGAQGGPTAPHHQVIEGALMAPGRPPQLGREGEGQQEVVARDQLVDLALQPLLALMVLAMGAGAVTAGVGDEALRVAGGALRLQAGAQRGTALLHGGQRLALAGQERVAVAGQELGLEGIDDGGQGDHCTAPHAIAKPSIRALMSWVALCPVWAVKWVYLAVVRIEWWPRIFCTSSRSTPASIRCVA